MRVSVSIGLAMRTAELKDPNDLLKAADQALFTAKQSGAIESASLRNAPKTDDLASPVGNPGRRSISLIMFSKQEEKVFNISPKTSQNPVATKKTDLVDRDRRSNNRYHHGRTVSFRLLGKAETGPFSGIVENVSRTGLCLSVDHEYARGSVLVLQIEASIGRFTSGVLLRVARISRPDNNRWQLGCTFVLPLEESEIQALLLKAP